MARKTIQELEAELAAAHRELAYRTRGAEDFGKRIDELHTEKAKFQAELTETTNKLVQAQGQRSALETELRETRHKCSQLERHNETLKTEAQEQRERGNRLLQEKDSLAEEVLARNTTIRVLLQLFFGKGK